jgi:hypothetical protein
MNLEKSVNELAMGMQVPTSGSRKLGIGRRLQCNAFPDGCNVGENIAHRSVEDETVDWLMERLGAEKGDGNECASCQRQDRSNSFEGAEIR